MAPALDTMPGTLDLGSIPSLWNDGCHHEFSSLLIPNGYNMDSRFNGPFFYENKIKKQYLLRVTNEIKVYWDSTGMPLITKKTHKKTKNTLMKENDSLESKMTVTEFEIVWKFY